MKDHFILAIFVFCSLGFLYFLKPEHDTSSMDQTPLTKKTQEYMIQAFVKIFEEGGSLKEELSASHWAYLPETQVSTFTLPHLTVYKPDGTVWFIDSKNGLAKQPTLGIIEQIELRDEVIIKRPATKTAVPIYLNTTKIHYYPKREFAENEEPVTLIKPDLTITGIGLRAFLNQGLVELLHNVKTSYTVH